MVVIYLTHILLDTRGEDLYTVVARVGDKKEIAVGRQANTIRTVELSITATFRTNRVHILSV